jgi:hypothetical protein
VSFKHHQLISISMEKYFIHPGNCCQEMILMHKRLIFLSLLTMILLVSCGLNPTFDVELGLPKTTSDDIGYMAAIGLG